uniref:Uncharacterized protein n=1 Tax=Nannochloropsis oculata TaxID=43925 RepID=A0A023PM20_9STRA|nr:hypothetical protein Naoc00069 [Nannochloropsis oculata]
MQSFISKPIIFEKTKKLDLRETFILWNKMKP